MAYFSKEFIAFFDELSKNNDRDWFLKNKKRYEKEVKQPFHQFVDEMIGRIQQVDKSVQVEPKDVIFRINRDVRFSNDKSPYKTYLSANISSGGRKQMDIPGFYIQMDNKKVMLGGGSYMIEKVGLEKIRYKIAAEQDRFNKLLKDKQFSEKYGEIKGEKNKVLPKDLKEAAEKQPLIYNKQFYYMADIESKNMLKDDFSDIVYNYYKAGQPVNNFLKEALTEA